MPSSPILTPPDTPAFEAPWQAEAFALVVALNEGGLFDWTEWTETLGAEIAAQPEPYYNAWLRALEALLLRKGVADASEIASLTAAWHRAAEATPHGKPIVLENDPERPR